MESPTAATDQFILEFLEYAFPHSFDMKEEPSIGNGISMRGFVVGQVEQLCNRLEIEGYIEQAVDKNGKLEFHWHDDAPKMVESARLDDIMVRYYGQQGHKVSGQRYIHMQPRFEFIDRKHSIDAYLEHVTFKRKLQALADLATED